MLLGVKATGFGLSLSQDQAHDLIEIFDLQLIQRYYNPTGYVSAVFDYEGEAFRLERSWTKRFSLYKGEWQSDPRWTGD